MNGIVLGLAMMILRAAQRCQFKRRRPRSCRAASSASPCDRCGKTIARLGAGAAHERSRALWRDASSLPTQPTPARRFRRRIASSPSRPGVTRVDRRRRDGRQADTVVQPDDDMSAPERDHDRRADRCQSPAGLSATMDQVRGRRDHFARWAPRLLREGLAHFQRNGRRIGEADVRRHGNDDAVGQRHERGHHPAHQLAVMADHARLSPPQGRSRGPIQD